MITVASLEAFWTAYREGSLRRAARLLHRSQPALSYQVRVLEEELGRALFERRGKRLLPTAAARTLALEAGEILARVRRLSERGGAPADVRRGRLRVAASHVLPPALLGAVAARFWRDWPDFSLDFRALPSEPVRDHVASGTADLGIVSGGAAAPPLESRPLFAYGYRLLLPRNARPAGLRSLEAVPLLTGVPGTEYRVRVDAALARAGLRPSVRA